MNLLKAAFLLLLSLAILLPSCYKVKQKKLIYKDNHGKLIYTYPNEKDTLFYLEEYFHPNGNIGVKGYYNNGKKDSLWQWWYENGKQEEVAHFKNGFYINRRTHWRENGTLLRIEVLSNPCNTECCCDGYIFDFDESGHVKYRTPIKNKIKHGLKLTYYPNGKIKKELRYKNDLLDGFSTEYDSIGNIVRNGNYVLDKKVGLWQSYYENGDTCSKYYYKNDKQEGWAIDFNRNRFIHAQGNFINGKEEGKWSFYDSLGKEIGYMFYKEGKAYKTIDLSANTK